jgi:hypothetical protein
MASWFYFATIGLCALVTLVAVAVIAWSMRGRRTRSRAAMPQARLSQSRKPSLSQDEHDHANRKSDVSMASWSARLPPQDFRASSATRPRALEPGGYASPHIAPSRLRNLDDAPEDNASVLLSMHMGEPTGAGSTPPTAFLMDTARHIEGRARKILRPSAEDVICSVFAPPQVRRGSDIYIQAFLHLAESVMLAALMAAEADPTANRRGSATLRTPIRRDSIVQFYLESPALIVRSAWQEIAWQGRPARVLFDVQVPSALVAASVEAVLHVGLDNIPVGEIAFILHIDERIELANRPRALPTLATAFVAQPQLRSDEPSTPLPVGTSASRYERAFISYSRRDFSLVSSFAEGLGEKGITPCVDVSSLEPGDEWAQALPAHINRADVFYLMWSDHAARSTYVDWEARCAVGLYRQDRQPKRPHIKPIPLHQPWPEPPEYLRPFHFYSAWQGHRAAHAVGLTKAADEALAAKLADLLRALRREEKNP